MFRLRTFGGLWLERDDQRVGGTSPRRLGLLAAVVAAGDHGVSRDRLLLLLWPDSTEAKARHALAQTLYSFRRELGNDLIRSEPAELLLDPAQLGSDFADFLDARNRGDFERAASLYTGPFLDGFYIPDADEFERWAEIERARLRELALQVVESAARRATDAGRPEPAAAHWQRLSVMAPHNSRIALGFMTSLAEIGDVAGAIQYGRAHELARRQQLGAQPDPAVGALLARFTRGEWRSSAPTAVLEANAPEPAPATPSAGPVVTAAPPRRKHRPATRWIAATGAAGTLALALWLVPPLLVGRSTFPAGSLVVMADPVDLTGEPGLSRALASAAVVGLQQSRHVTLLSRTRIADALKRMGRTGDSVLTDSLAIEVAARENARAVFALTVAKVSGKYLLSSRLISPATGVDLAVQRASVGRLDDVVEALDRLIRKVQASAGDPRVYRDSLPSLPLVTTGSLEALKLYAEGTESWRHAKYERAKQLFQQAIALDSGFALAHAAMGALYFFMNDRPNGDEQYAAAMHFRSRLTFREQLVLDGRLAGAHGNKDEESRIDGVLAERYPGRDTWYNYGTDLMRLGHCKEGIPALQRALAFDSAAANTYINLATCYKHLGENRLALDAYAAAERKDSTALVTNYINHEWGGVLVQMGRYAEAEAGFRRMLALPEKNDQARGHRSLAYLEMMQGHYRLAIDHLTTAAAMSREAGAGLSLMRNEVLLAEAYLIRGVPKLANRELDVALKASRAQYVEPGFLALLGRLLVQANRLPDAREVLGRIDAALKPDNPTDRSARGLLAAELALARGAPDAAADAIRGDIDSKLVDWRTSVTGRVLTGRGILDSALVVTAGFARGDSFGHELQGQWLLAPLSVARIAEALGDSATARAALQTFLDRWKEADRDLPVLRDARVHLARLQSEVGH